MSSIRLNYVTTLTVQESVGGLFVNPNRDTVLIDQLDTNQSLTSSTTPPVTKNSAHAKAMSAGAATIDLTSLPGVTGDETVNGTGLKVQAVKWYNPITNTGSITVVEGGSNGHPVLGASFRFTLRPGQELTFGNVGVDVGTDIAGADKTWDITGTGSESLYTTITMG